jgi:hypothetical protein
MRQMAWIRIVVALAAIAVFILGVRTGDDSLRWLAIGLLGVALMLRFMGRR